MFPWELCLDSCIISCGWRTHRECRGQVFLPGGYHDRIPCEQVITAVGSGGYSALPAHPFTWTAIKTVSPCPGWCTAPSFPTLVAILPRGCLCSCEGGHLYAAGTTQALSSVLARATRCWLCSLGFPWRRSPLHTMIAHHTAECTCTGADHLWD